MSKFLVIQLRAEDNVTESELKAILKAGKLKKEEIVQLRAEKNGLVDIKLDKYCGIIVGGSPFCITTPQDEKSEIQIQVEEDFNKLLSEVVKHDFPFIGACSGNGLLGNFCGVKMSRKYSESVGGVDITITDEGLEDKLLKNLPNPFRALVGHKEACDFTPEGAVLLATSKTCPVQMFRVGQNVYATQFHPEANSDEFILRVRVYKDHGYFAPEEAEKIIENLEKEKITVPQIILERFVSIYKT